MSIRLEEKPFEFEGKTYQLRCNMAVLDVLQDGADGDFGSLMKMSVPKSSVRFLTAMLNDYAEEQGWPERWTEDQIRRRTNLAMIREADVIGIVTRAITPPSAAAAPEAPPAETSEKQPEDSGN